MATIRIVEQPQSNYRMRYESESRIQYLLGETSIENINENDIKYTKIEISNVIGVVTLVVSCVTANEPYRVHPHKITGDNCQNGILILTINVLTNPYILELKGINISHTKFADIENSLAERKTNNIDPYNNGYIFNNTRKEFDLKKIRLCFQLLVRESLESSNIVYTSLPIVSNVINHHLGPENLAIINHSDLNDNCQKVFIVFKKLINLGSTMKVRFQHSDNRSTDINVDIIQQCVAVFQPPAYEGPRLNEDLKVFFQLYVPFDNEQTFPSSADVIGKYQSQRLAFTYKAKCYCSSSTNSSQETGQSTGNKRARWY